MLRSILLAAPSRVVDSLVFSVVFAGSVDVWIAEISVSGSR
jgi:hypothetical protein